MIAFELRRPRSNLQLAYLLGRAVCRRTTSATTARVFCVPHAKFQFSRSDSVLACRALAPYVRPTNAVDAYVATAPKEEPDETECPRTDSSARTGVGVQRTRSRRRTRTQQC